MMLWCDGYHRQAKISTGVSVEEEGEVEWQGPRVSGRKLD